MSNVQMKTKIGYQFDPRFTYLKNFDRLRRDRIPVSISFEYQKRIMYSNIQLTSQKSSAYVTFCFILTVVYFSSIAYNISVADNVESG